MKKILCDRQQFIDCAKGDLMMNIEGKIMKLGDGASHAMELHDKGHPIYLTENGVIISVIQDRREKYENSK